MDHKNYLDWYTEHIMGSVIFFFFQAEDGIRDRDGWLEFRRVLFRSRGMSPCLWCALHPRDRLAQAFAWLPEFLPGQPWFGHCQWCDLNTWLLYAQICTFTDWVLDLPAHIWPGLFSEFFHAPLLWVRVSKYHQHRSQHPWYHKTIHLQSYKKLQVPNLCRKSEKSVTPKRSGKSGQVAASFIKL